MEQGTAGPCFCQRCRNLLEVTSEAFPGERLIVCRNPLLAEERSRKREALLQATEAELMKIAEATKRMRNLYWPRPDRSVNVRLGLGQYDRSSPMAVINCGFNPSMQRIDESAQPVYRSLASFEDAH
ncbi:hypothetical protein [Burkholderia sp. BE17]|uniref:hypothetical protein n=1 Tax=Burkholderia sp. BE17 TaxID=2656644 RepID=UPI00128E17A5|nr:hypothetical protein [Burkholderia sp. BE17]MPV66795.1 hypothetical protein [Burkholderia sp. BE17]